MRRLIPAFLSLLVLASCSSSAAVEPQAGATYRGPLQGQDDLSGEVAIRVSASGDEITSLVVTLDVNDYDCGDSTISGRVTGSASINDGVPIVDGAFQDDSGTTKWQGSFKSDSLAEGTVQGTAAQTCDWGPFPWTATTSVTPEPPRATTSSTAPSTTTTTSLPAQAELGDSDFVEEFDDGLDAAWRWVSEDPTKWSISTAPGALQIIATTAPGSPPNNVLLRPAPDGDFEITTLLRFAPTSNFQFAGLVVYDDPTSFLQLGRAYCDVENSCVGDGIYFDSVEQNEPTGDNYAFRVRTALDVHLRLVAEGDTYTGYYSSDGETWVMIGSHTRVFANRQVGLLAHQTEVEVAAEFEFFRLTGDGPTGPIDSSLPSYTEVVAKHWAGIELCKTQAGISGGPDVFEFGAFGDEAPVISIREGYPSGFCPGARYIVTAELVLTGGVEFPVGTLLTLDSDLGFVAVSSWD